jgi:hypothetical protein
MFRYGLVAVIYRLGGCHRFFIPLQHGNNQGNNHHTNTTIAVAKQYSVCPNFQLHKNLVFQVQYNNVCDKASARRPYQEFWLEVYARF